MKPKRIQLRRKKGFRLPDDTVVVSRPSKWGNPYKVSNNPNLGTLAERRAEAVRLFRDFLERAYGGKKLAGDARSKLRGKNLACWCPLDQPCHADVLLELANRECPPNENKMSYRRSAARHVRVVERWRWSASTWRDVRSRLAPSQG